MTITKGCTMIDRVDTFEVVESFPQGYIVWNIGDNMVDGYLPLAQVENDSVNLNTLKAIKIDSNEELKLLREAAGYGVHDLKSAKRAMNRKNPKGSIARRKKELAEKTITIFERLS